MSLEIINFSLMQPCLQYYKWKLHSIKQGISQRTYSLVEDELNMYYDRLLLTLLLHTIWSNFRLCNNNLISNLCNYSTISPHPSDWLSSIRNWHLHFAAGMKFVALWYCKYGLLFSIIQSSKYKLYNRLRLI